MNRKQNFSQFYEQKQNSWRFDEQKIKTPNNLMNRKQNSWQFDEQKTKTLDNSMNRKQNSWQFDEQKTKLLTSRWKEKKTLMLMNQRLFFIIKVKKNLNLYFFKPLLNIGTSHRFYLKQIAIFNWHWENTNIWQSETQKCSMWIQHVKSGIVE